MNLALFASGSGTNAENLMAYFQKHGRIHVKAVVTNNASAGVIERAHRFHVRCDVFKKSDFSDGTVLAYLKEHHIDFIVLAGFLLLVPRSIISAYEGKIINLHPALLPAHGGKGFYGSHVHESVVRSGAIMSGITVHHVNEHFDDGNIIFQAACHVSKQDNPETLAEKIHELEYKYLPVVVEKILM